MAYAPETRLSLIRRLADPEDAEAWDEFVAVYSPLIYRFARQKGFQHADAQNVVQEVLLAVSKAVDSWSPDPNRGRFRSWLFRIARNLIINFLTRPKHRILGNGDSAVRQWLENQPDPSGNETTWYDREYRKEVFHWAADRVRNSVTEKNWQAFWLTAVNDVPVGEAAASLGISTGAVYLARSRIMSKLQEQVRQFQQRNTPIIPDDSRSFDDPQQDGGPE